MAPDTSHLVASILNSAWMVRHYGRGGRMSPESPMALQRQQAIQKLGTTVRHAFTISEDFEPLLAAICDGLRPKEEQPF